MNQLLVCSACSSSGSSDSHSKDCSAHSKISIPVIQIGKHISTMTIFKLVVGPNSSLNPGKAFFSWILSKRTCLWPLCQIADIKQLLDEYLSTYYRYFEKFNGSCEWRIYRLFDLAQLSWYWLFDFLYYISIYPNETLKALSSGWSRVSFLVRDPRTWYNIFYSNKIFVNSGLWLRVWQACGKVINWMNCC